MDGWMDGLNMYIHMFVIAVKTAVGLIKPLY